MSSFSLHTGEGGIKEKSVNTVLCVSEADLMRGLLSSHSLAGIGQGGTGCRSMEHDFSHVSPMFTFLHHFWASYFVWDESASAHHLLWEELPCISDPHSVLVFSLWENKKKKNTCACSAHVDWLFLSFETIFCTNYVFADDRSHLV